MKIYTNPLYAEHHEFIASLPEKFQRGEGKIIYDGRNQLRAFTHKGIEFVVKSFCLPSFINRIAYGWFRSSKAQRSYEYANILLNKGILTPTPIGYVTERRHGLFARSFYVSLKSDYTHNFNDIINEKPEGLSKYLEAVAQTTALLHNNGMLHKDYSAGNVLMKEMSDGHIRVEIIDLNRIRFHKIGINEGCKNFERLPVNDEALKVLSKAYAAQRGFDAEECYALMSKYCTYRV